MKKNRHLNAAVASHNKLLSKLKKLCEDLYKKLAITLFVLSHEDSNLDRQNQNLLYYLYTMGQKECKNNTMK